MLKRFPLRPLCPRGRSGHSVPSLAVLHIVPSTIIPCEEVIDRIISCIAVTLDIKVIDINISKHVSVPNDACDREWPN